LLLVVGGGTVVGGRSSFLWLRVLLLEGGCCADCGGRDSIVFFFFFGLDGGGSALLGLRRGRGTDLLLLVVLHWKSLLGISDGAGLFGDGRLTVTGEDGVIRGGGVVVLFSWRKGSGGGRGILERSRSGFGSSIVMNLSSGLVGGRDRSILSHFDWVSQRGGWLTGGDRDDLRLGGLGLLVLHGLILDGRVLADRFSVFVIAVALHGDGSDLLHLGSRVATAAAVGGGGDGRSDLGLGGAHDDVWRIEKLFQ
jgi:hypothetical protein